MTSAPATAAEIRAWLTEQIAAILSLPEDEIDLDETFDSFGLASRDAVSLSGDLEDYLERRLSPTLLYQYPTIHELADHLAQTKAAPPAMSSGAPQQARVEQPSPTEAVRAPSSGPELSPTQPIHVPTSLGATAHEPIAIVGIACRFPGADSPGEFWQLLAEGRDAISEVPEGRWDRDGLYDPEVGAAGKMSTKWGGFLSNLAHWDAQFFGVSPREASRMDPQQRLLLEAAWEALEDAGIPAERLAGSNTGVFVGVSADDYSRLQTGVPEHIDAYTGTGSALSITANRLSYFFDFHGPSLAVDTACSSSLVSVHLACNSLATGECDAALAGGVNVILTPETTISFSQAHMMAGDGRCKAFDATADGYVRGEGVGVVVLKRLSDAERDGSRVLAVIRGSAVNQDGRSNGLAAPNPDAQSAVISLALANAGVAPSQITYIEAHGTGTALGDPTELRGLAAALSAGRPPSMKAAIASAKTNIGHLESAAGIASLVKVALMLQHKQIPPSLHFERPNPHVSFDTLPVAVQTQLGAWIVPEGLPRLAGVSAFGFGGTNAHLIVGEYANVRDESGSDRLADRPRALNISARSAAGLRLQARAWVDFLAVTNACPGDLSYSAAALRSHHSHRLAVVGSTTAEWRQRVAAYLAGDATTGVYEGQTVPGKAHRVALVYSGQGTQWAGMGQELLALEPVFRAEVEAIDALWRAQAGWSIVDALQAADRLDDTEVAQPAIFALQAGITALLREWGLQVDGVTGHSVGEIAAAYAGGILTREDAVRVLFHRSRLMQAATGLGKMAAVGVSEEEARELIKGYEDALSIAAINSPHLVTLSGDAAALAEVARAAQARGIFHRSLPVNYAFHSPQMAPILDELRTMVQGIRPTPAQVAVYSTVSGRRAVESDYASDYWPRNVRQTVRFADAIRGLAAEGIDTFLEVGPHGSMVRGIAECLTEENGYTIAGTLQRGKPERAALLGTASQLYCTGVAPAWPVSALSGKRVDIPHYAWDRQYYWSQIQTDLGLAPASLAVRAQGASAGAHPLLGRQIKSPLLKETVFEQVLSTRIQTYLTDHRITGVPVVPATAYLELVLAAGHLAAGNGPVSVKDVSLVQALPLGQACTVQVIVAGAQVQIFSAQEDRESGERWTLHSSATITSAAIEPDAKAVPGPRFEVETIRKQCVEELNPAEFYRNLAQRGLGYGPAFRGVQALWRGENEALGRIALPASLRTEGYVLHPALLDACFHLLAAALPPARYKGDDFVYLPVAVERLTLETDQTARDTAWAHVQLRDETPAQGGQPDDVLADLVIAGESGEPLARVTGLCVRPVHRKLVAMMVGAAEEATAADAIGAAESVERAAPAQPEAPDRIDDWLYEVVWQQLGASNLPAGAWAQGLWLLLADETGMAAQLAELLQIGGGEVWLAHRAADSSGEAGSSQADSIKCLDEGICIVDGNSPAAMQRLIGVAAESGRTLSGVIYLWSVGAAADDTAHVLQGALHLTQALASTPIASSHFTPRLWLVTRQGVAAQPNEACEPSQAALWGFGNVAALEHPELRPVRIDLGADTAVAALATELVAHGREDRVALRASQRLVARLRRTSFPTGDSGSAGSMRREQAPVRLEITERGMLENLARVPMTRTPPGSGQVEIEVRAAGLNFRDVMNLLGLYPGDAGLLGAECAGVVVRTGPDVAWLRAGDRVMGIAPGCFADYTTTHVDLVTRIPDGLTFEEAATVPIAFLTAHYALDRLGKLSRGERVLIHAASGGVGLAAVQLARLAGAEVFATAGSPAKREFLEGLGLDHVMNSRSLAFSDQTLKETAGRGVDLVLNSLSGEFIPKSLAALAVNGRFVEIGKVGIWDEQQVHQVRPQASYHTIALDDLAAEQPALIAELLAELKPHFEAGRLKPLPSTLYPLEQASDGFRLMAQTRHVGKVVMAQPATTEAAAQATVSLREDATYLITGGLGALGLLVARRFVDRGARHLILTDVTEPSEAACQAIQDMEAAGATIAVIKADVSTEDGTSGVLSQIPQGGLPPLRGIVHAAGLLDDGMILQQTWPRFDRVLAPKAAGAWNLHRLTADRRLDFFVMFSSVASTLGSPGQANYAAANGFMDGLAAHRQAAGLPGLSLDWGPWAVGMAAAGDHRGGSEAARKRREASGVTPIEPEKGLDALERLILGPVRGQQVVAPILWENFAVQFPPDEAPALLKDLVAEARNRTAGGPAGRLAQKPAGSTANTDGKTDLVRNLEAAAPRDRLPLMVGFIRERTLKVLALEPGYPLDTCRPVTEMGLDSLMALELKNALDAGIGRKLPTTLVFEHPTIEALARHLVEVVLSLTTKAGEALPAEAAVAAVPDLLLTSATEEAIDEMSDEEVEAALLQKLLELDE